MLAQRCLAAEFGKELEEALSEAEHTAAKGLFLEAELLAVSPEE